MLLRYSQLRVHLVMQMEKLKVTGRAGSCLGCTCTGNVVAGLYQQEVY
jgi:hypothetical protein